MDWVICLAEHQGKLCGFLSAVLCFHGHFLPENTDVSKILIHIVGGIIIASMALAAMQIPFLGGLRMEGIVTGGIMPLVPGLAFVNAIRDLADSDYLAGTVKMIDAVMVFVYIAIGVGTALSVYHHVLGGIL